MPLTPQERERLEEIKDLAKHNAENRGVLFSQPAARRVWDEEIPFLLSLIEQLDGEVESLKGNNMQLLDDKNYYRGIARSYANGTEMRKLEQRCEKLEGVARIAKRAT